MKTLFKLALIAFLSFNLSLVVNAQVISQGIVIDPSTILISNPLKKKARKYKRALWKFTYEVEMRDGRKIEANSEIFKDPATGKHFLYHTAKDSVMKIFPELTKSIARPNPYNLDELIEGQPWGNTWRFQLTDGKISSWSDFQKTKEPQEFQVEGGEVLLISAPEFEALMKGNDKAWQAYQKKQYYLAITIFNKK